METLVCKECNKICYSWRSFSHHIRKCHNGKTYYDKYLKKETDGKCKSCGNITEFISVKNGYQLTCGNLKCITELKEATKKENNLLIYGVENVFQLENVKKKSKNSKKLKYGDENYSNREKAKQTCLNNFGVEQPLQSIIIREKIKKTNIRKYGVDHPWKNKFIRDKSENTIAKNFGIENPRRSEKFKEKGKLTKKKRYGNENYINLEKRKETCLNKYGVDSVFKVPEIRKRMFKTGLKIKHYKDTDLTYQGSYELHFLNTYYDKIKITKAPIIKYKIDDIEHEYFPDFYIPFLNLIIEIKSSYFLKKDKNIIKEKSQATISSGYNYLMILNKNYNKFNKLLSI